MSGIEIKAHGEIAWRHILLQFRDSPVFEALVRSLYQPLADLNRGLIDLLEKRTLAKATGAQLDGVGEIVGFPRPYISEDTMIWFGFRDQSDSGGFEEAPIKSVYDIENSGKVLELSDTDYRRLIYYKIALNNGHGTIPEIGEAVRMIFGSERVTIKELGNAKIKVAFDYENASDFLLKDGKRWIPKAAGVGVEIEGLDPQVWFGFRDQPDSGGFEEAPIKQVSDIYAG